MWSSSQQSFFIPTPTLLNPKFRNSRKTVVVHCSRSQPQPDNHQQQSPDPLSSGKKNENKLGKLAMIAMAASVLTFRSVHDASAAKTGGRIGGQSFKSADPLNSAPRIDDDNSRSICMPNYEEEYIWLLCCFFVAEAIGGLGCLVGYGGVFNSILVLMALGVIAVLVWRGVRLYTHAYAS